MFERKEKIWCLVGDEYDMVAYDADTPCRKGNRIFLLSESTRKEGDFHVYHNGRWSGPVCIASEEATVEERMYLWVNFPASKWGKPSDEDLKAVREAVERALSTDKFKSEVEKILHSTKVSVVSRENAYYGH